MRPENIYVSLWCTCIALPPMTNVTELVAHHFILFLGFYPSPLLPRKGGSADSLSILIYLRCAVLQIPNLVQKYLSRTISLESLSSFVSNLSLSCRIAIFEVFCSMSSNQIGSYRAGKPFAIIWEELVPLVQIGKSRVHEASLRDT